jgi:hypothetical protein
MFVSKKEWNKLQNKVDRLESKLLELKSEQEIKIDISTIKRIGSFTYLGFKTVPLRRVVKITEDPAKEAEFKLAAKPEEPEE